jgi:hypothetical protein
MVEEIETVVWACPFCDKEYDEEDDAQECLIKCSEPPTSIDAKRFSCDICKSIYVIKQDAQDCEKDHKEKEDSYYVDYLVAKDKRKLQDAADHRSQTRLCGNTRRW